MALNNEESAVVEKALGKHVSVHSATIARVYVASHGDKWEKIAMGAVAIISDFNAGAHYLKAVNLLNGAVTFSQEIYSNFVYQKPKNFFHTFEADNNVAGFSFADEKDAATFYNKVIDCIHNPVIPEIQAPPPPPTSSSSPISQQNTIRKYSSESPNSEHHVVPQRPPPSRPQPPPPRPPQTPAEPVIPIIVTTMRPAAVEEESSPQTKQKEKEKEKKRRKSFFSRSSSSNVLTISEPTNFRHISSIGWNPSQTTFGLLSKMICFIVSEIRDIPAEWRKLFQAAGIKKSDLKDKDKAEAVMKIIEQNTGSDLRTTTVKTPPTARSPPPPPSRGTARAPPPPPPTSGRPPPPPSRRIDHSENSNEHEWHQEEGNNIPGAPPPPPPPSQAPPSHSPSPQSPQSLSTGAPSRNQLLDQIRSPQALKKVEKTPNSPPPERSGGGDLADILKRAMRDMRDHLGEDIKEDENSDEDWSDVE